VSFNKRFSEIMVDAKRSAAQAKENAEHGRCVGAFYSASAAHAFSGKATGYAQREYDAGAINLGEYNRLIDVAESVLDDVRFAEDNCGWLRADD
jgi:hypothetical protein